VHGGRSGKGYRKIHLAKYSKYLGKTLREKFDEFMGESHHEMVSLYEELALVRTMASEAVVMFTAATEGADISLETKALASRCLQDALDRVKDLCLAISRIEKDTEDKVSLSVVDLLVTQIIRAVQREVGTSPEGQALGERIEHRIRNEVRLPKTGNANDINEDGTEITPDQQVLAMDAVSAPRIR